VKIKVFMRSRGLIHPKRSARPVFAALLLIALVSPGLAQSVGTTGSGSGIGPGSPPPDVSSLGGLPAHDPNAIEADGWLLYPSVRLYSLYTDNFFLTPTSPLSVGGLGVTPSLAAVWSNGIHTTTLYGNLDRQDYPTDTGINTLDGRAGFTQRYEAMRDLIFTFNGNYTHQTLATGLQNSIQTPSGSPATTVLANGNTLLPNGTILSPSGQVVGQATAASGSTIPLQVNPSNAFTGTFTIDKIFDRAALSLSGSINRTDFENQSIQPNFSSRTLIENASTWLGPLVYAYSSGTVTTTLDDSVTGPTGFLPSILTTSYRVVGGLGTRLRELFVGTVYFGHQGSEAEGVTAEGNVYGGQLSYFPMSDLTFTGTFDKTINISSQPFATNLALTLPGLAAIQLPLGESTIATSFGGRASYSITQQWVANCQLSYTRIEYPGSTRLDNSWIVDTTLRYDIWRNMSILWEYRYSTLLSNVPLQSFTSNYAVVGTTYRF
jgi:Putative beta-barrel porin 2